MTPKRTGTPPSLEDRVRGLEDVEEIRRLKVRYFEACDGGFGGVPSHVPEEISNTFTVDGVWDGGPHGSRVGRQAIGEFYRQVPQCFAYTMLSEPTIEVDGDRAIGRWNLLVYSTHGDRSILTGGTHHDEYVRTSEGWRIARTRFVSAVQMRSTEPWSTPAPAPEAG
jgi:SnoaL-like domain